MVRDTNNNTEGFQQLRKKYTFFCLLKLANIYLKDAVVLQI